MFGIMSFVDQKIGPEPTQIHSPVRSSIQSLQRENLHLPLVVAGICCCYVLHRSARLVLDSPSKK